jgi:hypothetical protein
MTVLHQAAEGGNIEVVRFFMDGWIGEEAK